MEELSANKMNLQSEWQEEEEHLQNCIDIIQHNIDVYSQKLKEISAETKELYDNYRSNNPELHNDLVIGLDFKGLMERTLNKNLLSRNKPYFGRIDYTELPDHKKLSLYIGKNGVYKNKADIVIVDWRAPISSVYYDSDVGESSYQTPQGEMVDIALHLKRTYEITNQKLIDFYDSDVISNDEFLTKYLGKNKEVVLGEIIATIQKEQNEIIRDTPWHSVIVQGVAGSGKTTVAMHRISYLLYNYKEKFRQDEFFIIGSNKMLLNYITGVLPNLDVYHINQMTMEDFFLMFLEKDFNPKKLKYKQSNSFSKLNPEEQNDINTTIKRFKSSITFIKALEYYLKKYEQNLLIKEDLIYHDQVLFSKEDILYFISMFQEKPLQEKIDLLNKRLANKLSMVNEMEYKEKEVIRAELKKYKTYFGKQNSKFDLMQIYHNFFKDLIDNGVEYNNNNLKLPKEDVLNKMLQTLIDKSIDLYDLGVLTFIKRYVKSTKDFEYVSHIVIDEAQDFGVMIFYILKHLFQGCTYTIMGDVTQNIHYDTGMNDWETLKEEVFHPQKDKFYILAKSYRNTVEISRYASNVLKHCTFKTYDIEPILRHGKEVTVTKANSLEEMVSQTVHKIEAIQEDGYDTIAVICRTVEETLMVYDKLKGKVELTQLGEDLEEITFKNGVMVLPIHMTKGLEFDAVILWNPDENSYQSTDADAKLLYVAITRALHELHIVYEGELSKLL